MRFELGMLLCGMGIAAGLSIAACSSDDDPSTTLGVGGFSSGTTTGDGGNMCPTDNCGACGPGTACCNGVCVDLQSDIYNCGACCKSCPNPHQICEAGQCGHAMCNEAAPPTCDTATEFCCDTACCKEPTGTPGDANYNPGELCCATPGGYACATPNANGSCPTQ